MSATQVLVLGIGNLLWADEGFGVRSVEALHRRFAWPDAVRLLDGGTQGLYLVNDVCDAERVLVLDAVDFGDPPGTVRVLRGDDVPRFTPAKKMSMHQTGLQDVLSAAELMGRLPREVVLIGVQPAELEDFGGSLTPVVAEKLEAVLALALDELRAWGVVPTPRASPAEPLLGPGLERGSYEAGRPSEDVVCRTGDARFFPRGEG